MESVDWREAWNHMRWKEAWNQLGGDRLGISR